MKKVLAAFDGTKYSEGASKYAMEIAKATNSMLVGVFIHDMRYLNFTYAYAYDQPFIDFKAVEDSQKEDNEKINLNIQLFHRACDEKGIHHKVHLDKGVPLQELLHESLFADILIIDSHTGFFSLGNSAPSPFLKDLLADANCPVLIVPHHYSYFDNAILCYDGSASSIHAMKMFAYLFPELNDIDTTMVSVNETSSNHLKENSNLKELARAHFGEMNYEVLHGNADDELFNFLKRKGANTMVVMGAYGRNALSRLFHQSISNRIIKELNMPVFIAHQ